MLDMHQLYPQYRFDKNKGYGTADHISALNKFGISIIHRKTFKPVKDLNKFVMLRFIFIFVLICSSSLSQHRFLKKHDSNKAKSINFFLQILVLKILT